MVQIYGITIHLGRDEYISMTNLTIDYENEKYSEVLDGNERLIIWIWDYHL